MTDVATYPWLVLRTKSRQENIVEGCLTQKRIKVFLPKRTEVRRWKERRKVLETPLFPGYVFVQPHPGQYVDLKYIPGSCGLVLMGNEPAKMPEKDLEGVRIMTRSGVTLSVNAKLIPGQRVEVLSGPFTGVQGELVRVKNQRCLVINAHLLSKSVGVEIQSEQLIVL
jgi:transcription antitermination factor NusG